MKSGIWGVVCLLLVAGGLYFAWTNLGQGVVEVNQQLTRKQAEVNTKRQAVDSYRNFASQLSAAQETLLKFEIASPEKPDPEAILVQLEAMAGKAGLTVNNTQPSSASGEEGQTDLVYALTVTGSFPQIIAFSEIMEKNIRPITFQTVNITASTGQEKAGTSGTFNLIVHYVPFEKATSEGQPTGEAPSAETTQTTQGGQP